MKRKGTEPSLPSLLAEVHRAVVVVGLVERLPLDVVQGGVPVELLAVDPHDVPGLRRAAADELVAGLDRVDDGVPGVEMHDHPDGELVSRVRIEVQRDGAPVVVDGHLHVQGAVCFDPEAGDLRGGGLLDPLAVRHVDEGDLHVPPVIEVELVPYLEDLVLVQHGGGRLGPVLVRQHHPDAEGPRQADEAGEHPPADGAPERALDAGLPQLPSEDRVLGLFPAVRAFEHNSIRHILRHVRPISSPCNRRCR